MLYNPTMKWWEADGIPITPFDDAGKKNFFPMVKVTVKNSIGTVLGHTETVLPISDEMSCKTCHASNSVAAARPSTGWTNLNAGVDGHLITASDIEKDWKLNILKLHDSQHLTVDATYMAALTKIGAPSTGLYARAVAGTPTLCAACHGTNALAQPNQTVVVNGATITMSSMTASLHTSHGTVKNPANPSLSLDDTKTRDTCYFCHPGANTKCLRGAMSNITDLECQSCHGTMAAVGQPSRAGWYQEPTCQACHHDGMREKIAVTNINTGTLRVTTDTRFASNPNTPAAGLNLFRFSTGHGGLQCEACHGSTHAEYASGATWLTAYDNDIRQSIMLQGYSGPIRECNICHAQPFTANKGPHGMHSIGQKWVKSHGDSAEGTKSAACKYCHDDKSTGVAANAWRGSKLSMIQTPKKFTIENRTISYAKGQKVGCYDCHNGPKESR